MKIRLLGGFEVEHDGRVVEVVGTMQRALLFRLALDPGVLLGYRALAEDVWPDDPPENTRAALQSLVSRLRSQFPAGTIESLPGGYRLAVERGDVDAVRFQDLVAAASAAVDPEAARRIADDALAAWSGPPWTPGDGYDWLERALGDDRATAIRLGGATRTAIDGAAAETEPSIPAALTPLIGREEELASVGGQLAMARLVTILGPGGAGKTRLALEAARAARRALVVELAPAGPDEVWQAVLGAVGREVRAVEGTTGGVPPRDRIVTALSGRDVLLVLDNCEHLVDAAARTVVDLLGALPRLRVLATSREPLGVPGEAFVPLRPLSPDAAEQLFADRVQAARGTAPGEDETDAAARIRRRLDGLPLALELAAAKARTMSLDEIAAGLDDRFALLTGGLRTVLPRHQTLRALVDWSWSLLDAPERSLLAAVSIYPAGIAAADAAEVARAHGASPLGLDALVDKSLLQRAGGRYRALETIREYGIEKLVESGLLEQRRIEQARWLGSASVSHDALLRGPRIHDSLAWFDAEDDNIVSALRFAAEGGHGPEVVTLAAANAWYWVIRDRNDDAETWLRAVAPFAANGTTDQDLIVRAVSVTITAFGSGESDDLHDALLSFDRDELERIRRAAADSRHELLRVFPTMVTAFVDAIDRGSWPFGVEVPDDADLDLPDWSRAVLGVMRAAMAQNRGDIAALGRASAEALQRFEAVGDLWGLAISKQMYAEWLAVDGQLEEALRISDESTAAMAQITSSWDLQQQQGLAVQLMHKLGRDDEARERSDALLDQARESESPRSLTLALYTAIFLMARLGDVERAQELLAELDGIPVAAAPNQRQVRALDAMARAAVAQLRGELDAAEHHLCAAADAAVASRDQPIMAAVAIGIGDLALERGDLATAATALDLAVALRGAADPHDEVETRIREAVAAHTETRPALGEGERVPVDADAAAASLIQILRR